MENEQLRLKTGRLDWVDKAKGIAILLVMLGHTIEMTEFTSTLAQKVRLLIYTLHVPTFLIASGFLLRYSKQGKICFKHIKQKFVDLVLVWVIWSGILTVWNLIIDRIFSMSRISILNYWQYSSNQVWYLWFLFICYVFAYFIEKIKINHTLAGVALIVFFVASSYLYASLAKVFLHILIFWIGYCLPEGDRKWTSVIMVLYIMQMIIVLKCSTISIFNMNNLGKDTWTLLGIKILGGLFIPCLFYTLAPILGKSKLLAYLGENTLYLYVLHFLPLAVYRGLRASTTLQVGIGVIFECAVAIAIHFLIEKSRVENVLFKPSHLIKKEFDR